MNDVGPINKRCGVCLQIRSLIQPIEGFETVLTCHACAKTIQTGIGFIERAGLILRPSSERLDEETGELTENGRTATKSKPA